MAQDAYELEDQADLIEFYFEQGVTDGLPVVPPTEQRVQAMLAATRRPAAEVIAAVPPNYADATVEKIAVNAVMAGCKPAYLPVVIAGVRAMCDERANLHGVQGTTPIPPRPCLLSTARFAGSSTSTAPPACSARAGGPTPRLAGRCGSSWSISAAPSPEKSTNRPWATPASTPTALASMRR